MEIYFARDGWCLEEINEDFFFCYPDPGLVGLETKIKINKDIVDYAIREKPNFDSMLRLLNENSLM